MARIFELQGVFAGPEGLASIDQRFQLGRHIIKKDRRSRNDNVRLPQQAVYLPPHIVIYGTIPLPFTDRQFLARFDVPPHDLNGLGIGASSMQRRHEHGQQQVAVAFLARAALQSKNEHRLSFVVALGTGHRSGLVSGSSFGFVALETKLVHDLLGHQFAFLFQLLDSTGLLGEITMADFAVPQLVLMKMVGELNGPTLAGI
jgi:hypothetical protein